MADQLSLQGGGLQMADLYNNSQVPPQQSTDGRNNANTSSQRKQTNSTRAGTKQSRGAQPASRKLITWTAEKNEHLLVAMDHVAKEHGMRFPYDHVARLIHEEASGGAIEQHISKIRQNRLTQGLPTHPYTHSRRKRVEPKPLPPREGVTKTRQPRRRKTKFSPVFTGADPNDASDPDAEFTTNRRARAHTGTKKPARGRKRVIKIEDSPSIEDEDEDYEEEQLEQGEDEEQGFHEDGAVPVVQSYQPPPNAQILPPPEPSQSYHQYQTAAGGYASSPNHDGNCMQPPAPGVSEYLRTMGGFSTTMSPPLSNQAQGYSNAMPLTTGFQHPLGRLPMPLNNHGYMFPSDAYGSLNRYDSDLPLSADSSSQSFSSKFSDQSMGTAVPTPDDNNNMTNSWFDHPGSVHYNHNAAYDDHIRPFQGTQYGMNHYHDNEGGMMRETRCMTVDSATEGMFNFAN